MEDSNFNFRYSCLGDLHIPREKWLNYLQTVETLIKCHILQHLIWVCTVCQLPFLRVSRLQWDKETKTLVNANKKTARIILFVSGFYESSKTFLVIRIIIFHFFLHKSLRISKMSSKFCRQFVMLRRKSGWQRKRHYRMK